MQGIPWTVRKGAISSVMKLKSLNQRQKKITVGSVLFVVGFLLVITGGTILIVKKCSDSIDSNVAAGSKTIKNSDPDLSLQSKVVTVINVPQSKKSSLKEDPLMHQEEGEFFGEIDRFTDPQQQNALFAIQEESLEESSGSAQ